MSSLFGIKYDGFENNNKYKWDQYVECKNELKIFRCYKDF